MDPFVRRLVLSLFDPARPLSRNRHFHTFDNAEGRKALKVHRRLVALEKDLAACRRSHETPVVHRTEGPDGQVRIEIRLEHLKSRRTTILEQDEWELLLERPGVAAQLNGAAPEPPSQG